MMVPGRQQKYRIGITHDTRGVGKTTFLIHQSSGSEMLYMSVDNPLVAGADLSRRFVSIPEMGTRPFYREGEFDDRMVAVLEKTLHADVPFFVPRITDGNSRLMNAIVVAPAKWNRANMPAPQHKNLFCSNLEQFPRRDIV